MKETRLSLANGGGVMTKIGAINGRFFLQCVLLSRCVHSTVFKLVLAQSWLDFANLTNLLQHNSLLGTYVFVLGFRRKCISLVLPNISFTVLSVYPIPP